MITRAPLVASRRSDSGGRSQYPESSGTITEGITAKMRKPHYPPRNAEPQGESPTVTMRYDKDVLEAVDDAAKRAGVNRSEWIRKAVESALKGELQ